MKKRSNSRQGLSSDARAWLDGKTITGNFFQFKPSDELHALWREYGDTGTMFWRWRMKQPIPLEELETLEDEWLNAEYDDKYGFKSYFVYQYYDDAEKQTLFAERGDTETMYWKPGMRRPMRKAA